MGTTLDDDERASRVALMRADLDLEQADHELKRKQKAWETPRNILLLATGITAIVGTMAGWIGYRIGQTPSPPPIVVQVPVPQATK